MHHQKMMIRERLDGLEINKKLRRKGGKEN